MIFLGPGGAGKTNTIQSLLGKRFITKHIPTEALDTRVTIIDLDEDDIINEWKECTLSASEVAEKDLVEELVKHSPVPRVTAMYPDNLLTKGEQSSTSRNTEQAAVGEPVIRAEPDTRTVQQATNILSERKVPKSVNTQRLNIWDCAGQNDFYLYLHIFMDNRSIFCVTFDISKPFDWKIKPLRHDKDGQPIPAPGPETIKENLDYWLDSIYSHVGKVSAKRIILIGTHKDKFSIFKWKQNRLATKIKQEVLDYVSHHPARDLVYGFYIVSNKDRGSDMRNLRRDIFNVLEIQEYWGQERPVKWLVLENALKKKADTLVLESSKPESELSELFTFIMGLDEVNQYADTHGIDEEELYNFLSYHHSQGDFTYFDTRELRNHVVIHPSKFVGIVKVNIYL